MYSCKEEPSRSRGSIVSHVRLFAFGLLLLCLSFMSSISSAESLSCILNVPYITQETNYYCGPASVQIIASYKGKTVSQSTLAGYSSFNYIWRLTEDLNDVGLSSYSYTKTGSGSEAAFGDAIFASLVQGYPVIVHIRLSSKPNAFGYTTSSGHYVVATGAYVKNGVKHIKISDPFSAGWYNKKSGQYVDLTLSELWKWHQKGNLYIISVKAGKNSGTPWSQRKEFECDEGRWYVFSASEVKAWQSASSSSNQVVYTYPAARGIIITGSYPVGSKLSGNATWYRTKEGYYIKASDLVLKPQLSAEKSIGTIKHDNLSITVKSKYSNHWLTAQPYADTDKMVMVGKGTEMKAVKVIYNTANHYWVQVEYNGGLYYTCVNNVEVVVKTEPNPVTISNKVFPSGNLGDIKSFDIKGTVKSTYKITKATGGVYSSNYTYEKPITVNKTSFDLYSSAINVSKNGGIAFGTIPDGSYTFKLVVEYERTTWQNQTRDDVDPIQTTVLTAPAFTSTFNVVRGTKTLITNITLDITSKTLLVGENFYIKETVKPDNATNKKLDWSSSNTSVATVADGKVMAVGKGTATITAAAQDGSGKKAVCTVTVLKKVTSVSISPDTSTLYVNGSSAQQMASLTANVQPTDASNKEVTWSSSDSKVVSVDQSGIITAKAVGIATITAKANDGSGKQGTCQVTVLSYVDAVSLLPANSTVNVGSTIKLTASVSPVTVANSSLTWTSSDTGVATVDNVGNVTGIGTGTATITATAADRGTKFAQCTVTVQQPVIKIILSGASTVLKGKTTTITAAVQPSNADNKAVSWSSEDTSVATVDNGVVTGVSVGNTIIWASAMDGSGIKTPHTIRVTQPVTGITISGESIVPVSGTVSMNAAVSPANADNRTLAWTVVPSTIASVNSQGVVTGLQPGTAVITASATDGSGVSKEYSIQVVKQIIAVRIEGENLVHTGSTAQLTAVVTSDEPLSDTSVTWTSSNPAVVTVNAITGIMTGVSNGTATITATSNAESYYSTQHQVTVDTLINQITISGTNKVDVGNTTQLSAAVMPSTASNKQLVWTSGNESVALVDNMGKVQAVGVGTVTITATATDGSGVKGTLKVTVYPLPNQINITGDTDILINTTTQMNAEVLPSNVRNKTVVWTSSDETVATVNSAGLVTAVGNGKATITATAISNTAVTAKHEVKVTTLVSEVTLDAPDRVDVGEMGTVTATVLPITASNKQLIWTSSDEDVAVVDDSGNVFGISAGYVKITATTVDGSEIAVEADIQIFQAIQSISVNIEPVMYTGQVIDLNAIILPEDASAPAVSWTTSNESVAVIESRSEVNGECFQLNCIGAGITRLTATATDGSGVSGYAYIQVVPYTELTRNTASYTVYTSGSMNGVIDRVSLTSDCSVRAAEEKHGAVWTIEHVSGEYAAALGIFERTYSYSGFTLANGVDLMLLGVNHTGSDIYRVTCTINGQADTCLVTVKVETPAESLPETISLPTTTFSAMIGEAIVVDISPIVSPATSALPVDANPSLFGVDNFNRYAQVDMGDDVFTVTFSKAGVYTAYVRYQGSNYQYDAYVTFVITTTEGIVPPEVESLTIDNSLMYLLPGETAQFDVVVNPSGADDTALLWSSSDPDVVMVAADGTLTAVSTGTAIITVSAGNGISTTAFVVVTESLLSIDWNPNDMIEVYVEGQSKMVIQKVFLTTRASAQLSGAPIWTMKRLDGNNLTLTCEPITATNASGDLLYGCAIVLKSVSSIGTTEYELTCNDGVYSANTTIQVNANSIESDLPSLVQWSNTTFTGRVNERMAIYPVVQCWPENTSLPDEVTISIEGDSYWNAALKTADYTISRGMITFAFNEPGVYTANCVYSCANMKYLVPITVRIADGSGNIPIRLAQLTLNTNEISIEEGMTYKLNAITAPADATDKSVTWSSDNPDVAVVSSDGLVTGVSNGTATIWCTPNDSNCRAVKCDVVVEDAFTITEYTEMPRQYLQGTAGFAVTGYEMSPGTASRIASEGATLTWSLTRVSGNSAAVELQEREGVQWIVATELLAGGADVYEVTCTAGTHTWTGRASLEVVDLGAAAPATVAIAQSSYTVAVGEEVELDFTPICSPSGTAIPAELRAQYVRAGNLLTNLVDSYRSSVRTATGDKVKVAFKVPGTYLMSRRFTSCNLTYVVECTIIVGDGSFDLLRCTDTDPVVYLNGQSSIASTCYLWDTSVEELYGNEFIWNAERISGDCLTVALRADQSSASLYVVNAKEEGEETWRVSCTFRGLTDSVDITIHSVVPRTELPETVSLYQTSFDGMIGNAISVLLAVCCEPADTSLPTTNVEDWSFSADGNTASNAEWTFADGQMSISFSESGYYGGRLIYQSGNVTYSFPVSFAITDEESVQSVPEYIDLFISSNTMTVYPEGETSVALIDAVLSDSLNMYSVSSISAYAERCGTTWSIEILSGSACALSVQPISAASAQIVLDSISGTGDVTYRVSCSLNGTIYSKPGTIHVAGENEARPDPKVSNDYFTTPTGTVLRIDASFYDRHSNLKLCSGAESVWENTEALAAMGFDYDISGDFLLPTFYETGSYVTTISNMIGNLRCSQEVVIVAYDERPLPESPSTLSFPRALQEIEAEAFANVKTHVIDMRGTNVTTIQALAFAGNSSLMRVYLPACVTSINVNAFDGCTGFVVYCVQGSYADSWARENRYPIIYMN